MQTRALYNVVKTGLKSSSK